MEDRAHIVRRITPPLAAVALVEAALYLVFDRSATLHDLYRSPAVIVLVLGAVATAMRLRGRHRGDRRHAPRRVDGDAGGPPSAGGGSRDEGSFVKP